MRFTRISMKDFVSYETQDLELAGMDYVAIAGANGSGKSTIALAIAWALFGTIRVKGDSDSVVRDGSGECEVVLEFTADGSEWRIERTKKRTKSARVRLYSRTGDGDWAPYGDHLNATAQTRIEELVGMSEDAFYSLTVIDGQSGARFVKADSTLRRDILLNLLPEMSVWAQMEATARDMLTRTRSSVESEQSKIAADEERVEDLKARAEAAQAEFDAFDADSLPTRVAEIDQDIAALSTKIADATKVEQEALDEAEREQSSRLRELNSDTESARRTSEASAGICKSVKALERDGEQARESLALLRQELDSAQKNEKVLDKEYKSVSKRQSEVDDLKARAQGARDAVKVAEARVTADEKSLRGLEQMRASHAVTCPTCQTHLDEETLAALIGRIQDGLETARTEIEERNAEASDLRSQATGIEKTIDDAAEAADEAERVTDRIKRRVEDSEASAGRADARLSAALSDAGVKTVEELCDKATSDEDAYVAARDAVSAFMTETNARLEVLREALEAAKVKAASGDTAVTLNELRQAKRSLAERIREADLVAGRLDALRTSLRDTTESIRARRESISEALARVEALDQVVAACRPQGIPSMLLDGVLAPIEAESTRILNAVPGGEGMMLRFEQARALKSRAGEREVLDIIITMPSGIERPIESLSAGETVRVSLALVFAMIAVLGARRGADSLDTVFLDEPLGPLDQDAVPAFIEVLRSAVSTGSLSSVMVVTHDQRVIEALPQRIEVEREQTGVSVASIVA